MNIKEFYHRQTYTLTYLVYDPITKDAIAIDPVLDFDPASGKISDESAQKVASFIRNDKLKLHAILETHAHADHLSGSQVLKSLFPQAKTGIGEKIRDVQVIFKKYFNLQDLATDGHQFDFLFKDYQEIDFGTIQLKVIPSPGHTPADVSYLINNNIFTGDSLFMPDYGTGRCDFPKGSAKELYHSITKNLYSLPDDTNVFVGHDYQPGGRELKFKTTIGESKRHNIQLKSITSEEEFVSFRNNRDTTLEAPKLLLPSIQVNIQAGRIPEPENNGMAYLKIPLIISSATLKLMSAEKI